MKKTIFIVNGYNNVGKDTFVDYLSEKKDVVHYSIIDICRNTLRELGVDVDNKTSEMRKNLSDFKVLLETWDIPFKDVKSLVDNFNDGSLECDILCIDMRECKDIEKAVREFKNVKTILITNNRIEQITSNIADANVNEYKKYDYILPNNGTLDEFKNNIDAVLNKSISENICQLYWNNDEIIHCSRKE